MWFLGMLLIIAISINALALEPATAEMVEIKGGIYKIFFKEKDQEGLVTMSPFFIDKYPVTQKDYLEFVRRNPLWKKSATPKVFATENYLQNWLGDLEIPAGQEKHPVVFISWFAAKKYCEFYDKRLLTVNEWEYAADAANPLNTEKILAWYGRPNSTIGNVGNSTVNKFGLHDMHGLVWEWVDDYASVIIKGDSRSDNSRDRNLFCGSGSLGATSTEEYTTFMRFAFRSSLKGNYVTENLGFRCGRDKNP
jgi:formylglycine-generating enzyme required for sulfatase activity